MPRLLSDDATRKVKIPNSKDDNRCLKCSLGGAKDLYLFVYRPNKEGVSIKKYKIKRLVGGKEETLPLKNDSGSELTYPKVSMKKARSIALV